jgi:hypothetical protein
MHYGTRLFVLPMSLQRAQVEAAAATTCEMEMPKFCVSSEAHPISAHASSSAPTNRNASSSAE